MNRLIFIILVLYSHSNFGQEKFEKNSYYLNYSFEKFNQNPKMDSLEMTIDFKFSNIISCIISFDFLNKQGKEIASQRLEELANKFYNLNSPIYLLSSGKNSVEQANTLNSKEKKGLVYVSLGNSCLSSEFESLAINIFNSQTDKLLK